MSKAIALANFLDFHWIEHERCHPNDAPMCESAAAELRRLSAEVESLRSERTAWRVTAENAEKQLEDLKRGCQLLQEAVSMIGSQLIKDTFGYEWHEAVQALLEKTNEQG